MNKEIEELNRLIAELEADKQHLIQSAMDGSDMYHYTAHDIGYRDLERECKHLKAENKILNRELLIKQVEIDSLNQRIAELEADNKSLIEMNTGLVDENNMLRSQQNWIPVSERLPEEGTFVWIRDSEDIAIGYCEDGEFYLHWYENLFRGVPTHWMPLPNLPKDGEG